MKFFKSPKSYPYMIVVVASIVMFTVIAFSQTVDRTFPLLLFMSAKLCLIFGCVELGLNFLKLYKEKEDVYKSISRSITSFGMAMCFMLLIATFEVAN